MCIVRIIQRDNAIKYAEKWSDDYNIQFPKFQKGDLFYFDGNGDGIYTHASIISSIIKDKKNPKKIKTKNSIVCILQMK